MRELPDRPDLDQLRRQARALHRAARAADGDALRRMRAVSLQPTLAAAQLALAREHGYPSWARLKAEVERRRAASSRQEVRPAVRPVASIEELVRVDKVICAQFPARHYPPVHGLDALKARFEEDHALMCLAERDGQIIGGALALRTGDAVKVTAIALEPEARGLGIGRMLLEAVESEAIRLGVTSIYLGGANAENRGFYWRLGFAGRRSLMHKGLPIAKRFTTDQLRRRRLEDLRQRRMDRLGARGSQ